MPPLPDGVLATAIYLVRELGLTTALIGFICYMLAIQLPAMRDEIKQQTGEMVKAVDNNNRVVSELTGEIRALRKERAQP